MQKKLAVIKFGGGLIAPKDKQNVINDKVLNSLSEQISQFDGNVIVVHGAGSFGHTYALEYELHKGFKSSSQYKGLVKTHQSMERLNYEVVESLRKAGVNAISIQTSAITITKSKRIEKMFIDSIKQALTQGLTPVLYGDVVFDEDMRFCILSGDQILTYLAKELEADLGIFAADVDGVYTANPKEDPNAELIPEIPKDSAEKFIKNLKTIKDATGGIITKVIEVGIVKDTKTKFIIGNGAKENWLIDALNGKKVRGTYII